MSLRELDLKEQYRSDRDDLLSDFYYPCLERSDSYERAVGFFTSSGLSHAAKGLVGIINRGGTMRLVASPRFTAKDIENIRAGYALRDVVSDAAVRELESIKEEVTIARVSNLAWLVSHGLLDIKVAVTTDPSQGGIYHEKVGLFHGGGDTVAFSGSPNETEGGLVSNFECIDVYTSWKDARRVELKVRGFQDLWTDKTHNLQVIDFPEAAKRRLISHVPSKKPTREPGLAYLEAGWFRSHGMQPYSFQREAISAWITSGCRGILEMATGTGKTFTALAGLSSLIDDGYSVVIVVPRRVLASQWERHVRRHYPDALVLVCTGEYDWRRDFHHFNDLALQRVRAPSSLPPVFFISTFQTASSDGFLDPLKASLPFTKLAVVVDEVHWAGAETFSRILELNTKVRLGLSATPKRHFDPDGTQQICSYFGEEPVYRFSLHDAIQANVLTPYEYHVKEVNLSLREYQEYQQLSRDIAREIARSGVDEEDQSTHLMALLAKRANIVKSATEKSGFLEHIHRNYGPHRCLVYCANLEHLRATAVHLANLGGLVGQYHSEMSEDARKRALTIFEEGYLDYLVSVRCLDEGVDIPDCADAIILSSSSNSREFIQRRGRVLRRAQGKDVARIFDPVVVPSPTAVDAAFDLAAKKILGIELDRVYEFGSSALNSSQIAGFVQILKARYAIA